MVYQLEIFSKIIIIFTLLMCLSTIACSSEILKVVTWKTNETENYLFFAVLIFLVSFGKLCYHKLHFVSAYLPESFLLILFGIIAGAIVKYCNVDHKFYFTPEIVFLILLPPIVLDSAFRMYNRTFGELLGIVIIFAVLGTVFCFLIIAFVLYGLEHAGILGGIEPNLMPILLFSSLIVAVDPVAVLAIFKDLGVEKELYYMIFGESLLNDAVTIVLYEIMTEFIKLGKEGVNSINIALGLASFFTVSIGGLFVGLITGVLSSLLTRFHSSSEIHCITLLASSYISYMIAYSLKWSGIIGIIGCGIVQASYGFKNITKNSQMIIKTSVELLASINEAIIFVFLGVQVFLVTLVWNAGFQVFTILMCIISRFFVIWVLRIFINYVKVDQRKLTWTELFIATYGGLRGAISFALVILIEPELLVKAGVNNAQRVRDMFVTTTLLVVMFTVSCMGTTMKPLARLLKVNYEKPKMLSVYNELNIAVIDNLMTALEVLTDQRGRNRFRVFISSFDNHYVRPWLVNDPHDNNTFKIVKRYEEISLVLHYASLDNQIDENHLSEIPKSLWPKPKDQSEVAETGKLDKKVIKIIKKLSRTVKNADPISMKNKKLEYSDLLESTCNNRLNDIVRRKSTVCQNTNKLQLPINIINLIPIESRWKLISSVDNFNHKNLPASSFQDNCGFNMDEEMQNTKICDETKI